MNKSCARCEKIVYPTEELKCLDKVWHKGCFKCQCCGMQLNMRTYKGYNKDPYCEAHIPKAKATTMAETPELKRIAENTKIQSNVKYHADFEKSKGKFTQVADDPETLRIKQNSKIISNVAYHGDLEKKAAMEQKRTINENGEYIEIAEDVNVNANHQHKGPTSSAKQPPPPIQPIQEQPPYMPAPTVAPSAIGKISDYDPLNEQPRNSPYSSRQNQTVIYTSNQGAVTNPPSRKIGSIADIDPINNVYGSLTNPEYQHQHRTNPNHNQYHQNHAGIHQPPQQPNTLLTRVYRAMYDYDAQDSDEVSFCEGDLIVNVSNIDAGWMTGMVKRTGETGMLPANYVELAHI